MHQLARQLRNIVGNCVPLLLAIEPKVAAHRPAPGKWSKQEILGHLIDSAGNNQQKFVRLLIAKGPLEFVGYVQDDWVAQQHYQTAEWQRLVDLWRACNEHLAWIIENADPARLGNTILIDGKGPYRLDFVMSDYVEHLKHHLKQVLPAAGLASAFVNVYGA